MTNPYAVLGVSPTATQAEITHAYRHQLRTYHPDVRPGMSRSTADERLRQIIAAYALLRDPTRRADYDHISSVAKADSRPITMTVTRTDTHDEQVPLWAGPVRWHR